MAARLRARVGFQAAGRDLHGRICREMYHAVVSGVPVRVGVLTRHPREALCGASPVGDCPPGLFAPLVSCQACLAIVRAQHVEMIGGQL